jgi:hypothetical protein
MNAFQEAMRRIITGDDAGGKSVVIIDGGPSSTIGDPNLGGLFESGKTRLRAYLIRASTRTWEPHGPCGGRAAQAERRAL